MKAACFCGKLSVVAKDNGTTKAFREGVQCFHCRLARDSVGSPFAFMIAGCCETRFELEWNKKEARYTDIKRSKLVERDLDAYLAENSREPSSTKS